MRVLIVGVALLLSGSVGAFAQAPSTDIFLFPVEGASGGERTLVTDREG